MAPTWKDFATASNKAVDDNLRADQWPIYRYELKGVGDEAYIHAPLRWVKLPDDPKELERYREHVRAHDDPELASSLEADPAELASYMAAECLGLAQPNEPKPYAPLNYPDIFLQFANLVDEGPITPKVMLEWAQEYGVLGLRRTMKHDRRSSLGGAEENVANFALFAEEANMILRLYDTVTAPNGPDYEYVREHPRLGDILLFDPFAMKAKARYEQDATVREVEPAYPWMVVSQSISEMVERYLMEAVDEMSPERLKEVALEFIDETIHQRVVGECHPRLYRQKDGTARRGWGFKSLLGAMWLQMMWLRSAPADEIDRCPWCRKIIAFEPQPEQPEIVPDLKKNARKMRKTREDKIYCDDLCKAKWNYHYGEGKSSKLARKRERERRKSDDNLTTTRVNRDEHA